MPSRSPLPAGSAPGFKLLVPIPPIPNKELQPADAPDSDDEALDVTATPVAKPSMVEGEDQVQATKRKRAAEEAGLDAAGEEKKARVGEGEGAEVITLD